MRRKGSSFFPSLCTHSNSHNDLAIQLRGTFKNQLGDIDLLKNTSGQYGAEWQTDIPRLRAGHLGGQVYYNYLYICIYTATIYLLFQQHFLLLRLVRNNSLLFSLQFWSAYMPCSEPSRDDATRTFLDQMDVIKLFVQSYSQTFMYATTADDIDEAFKANKV